MKHPKFVQLIDKGSHLLALAEDGSVWITYYYAGKLDWQKYIELKEK